MDNIREISTRLAVLEERQKKDVDASQTALVLGAKSSDILFKRMQDDIAELKAYKDNALGRQAVISVAVSVIIAIAFFLLNHFGK